MTAQLEKELVYIFDILPFAAVCAIAAYMVCRRVLKSEGKYAAIYAVYALYFSMLFNRVWFCRIGRVHSGIVLDPFWAFSGPGRFFRFLLNIVMFVPFGALVAIYGRGNNRNKGFSLISPVVFSLLLSIIIETVQGIFHLGDVQTDDVISNVLGGVLGYFAWMSVSEICSFFAHFDR